MDFEREVREKVLEFIKEDRDRKEIHQFHKEKVLKYLDEGGTCKDWNSMIFFKFTVPMTCRVW